MDTVLPLGEFVLDLVVGDNRAGVSIRTRSAPGSSAGSSPTSRPFRRWRQSLALDRVGKDSVQCVAPSPRTQDGTPAAASTALSASATTLLARVACAILEALRFAEADEHDQGATFEPPVGVASLDAVDAAGESVVAGGGVAASPTKAGVGLATMPRAPFSDRRAHDQRAIRPQHRQRARLADIERAVELLEVLRFDRGRDDAAESCRRPCRCACSCP